MPRQPVLYAMSGLPFAGKSGVAVTLARVLDVPVVRLDAINTERGIGLDGTPITGADWQLTYSEAYRQLERSLTMKASVIFDHGNFSRAERDQVRAIGSRAGARVQFVYVPVTVDEVRRRLLANRARPVRSDVRDDNFEQALQMFEAPDHEPDVSTPESVLLIGVAQRVARAYVTRCSPQAILLTGSAASGEADCYSDMDMCMYYSNALPPDAALQAARDELGAQDLRELSPRTETWWAETYQLDGIECQIGHTTIANVEQDSLVDALDPRSPGSIHHKVAMGLLRGIPLHGDELIQTWQSRVEHVPPELARSMVEHYLQHIFPLWFIADGLERRDATAWVNQMLAEAALNLIGVLAGLNGRFYSTFQFKRAGQFLDGLPVAPYDVADRIERLFSLDTTSAIRQLEVLVGETLALAQQHMPEADTRVLRRKPGERQSPWRY